MNIRLITAVWGREFVEIFLRIGIRSLLAEGNAHALARAHKVTYTIFTTPEDREALESNRAFADLCKGVNVQFSLFALGEIDSANPSSHGIFWYRGIDLARRNREVLFFIMPDVLYARGTLLAWARRFEDGAKAVFTVGPRVALEPVLLELAGSSVGSDQALDFSRDQLLEMLFRNIHPVQAVMRRGSPRRFPHPEYDLRILPGRGVIIRELVSHPFCIEPGHFSKLRYFSPEDHIDSLAYEPCSTVSVEPVLKFVDQWYRPLPSDENYLSSLGAWWDWHNSRSCERESEHPFELLLGADRSGSGCIERSRAIAGGRYYRSQVIITWKIFKLFGMLREAGLRKAAALLAAAVYAGRLRRRIFLRGEAILLVPTDAACAADRVRLAELLLPGRERELIDLVRNHIVVRQDEPCGQHSDKSASASEPSERAWYTARGARAEAQLSALQYAEPFALGPFTIYRIDRVLWDVDEAPATAGAGADYVAGEAPITNGVAVVEPLPHFDWPTFGGAIGHRLGRSRPVVRSGIHRGALRLARVSSRVAFLWSDVPVIGRSARLCSVVLQSALQDGARVTAKRIASRTGITRVVKPLGRLSRSVMTPARAAFHSVRRNGVAASIQEAVSIGTVAVSSLDLTGRLPFDADRAILDDVRRFRALQAAEQVTADFMQRLDFRDRPSTLLEFLHAKLHELAKADGLRPCEAAASRLGELTAKYPAWADAWLELGFLHQDEHRPQEALKCFERAMNGSVDGSARPNAVALAAANRGRFFAANRNYEEAVSSFAFSLRHDPEQGLVSVEYADALRRCGAPEAALEHYERGMCYRPPIWQLPRMPRDAGTITLGPFADDNAPRGGRLPLPAVAELSPRHHTLEATN